MIRHALLLGLLTAPCVTGAAAEPGYAPEQPVRLIYDTDIGNDVDDALALGVIHALESRGECELLAVTITKDHPLSAAYVDAVNTFYGRPDIPIGVVHSGATPEPSKFTVLAETKDGGEPRYPHDLRSGDDAPEAHVLMRRILAAQPDHSVAIAQVGFSTNVARLLDSGPDEHSELNGVDLVAKKVALLSVMAGAFAPIDGKEHIEYNVVKDIPAAQALAEKCPVPIVYSGFEIGISILYPAASIEQDYNYVEHHPLAEAYQLYMPTPHERPTWDLTSVLFAVRPGRGYFGLSPAGKATVTEAGKTEFAQAEDGNHFYLTVDEIQIARVREALALLSSEPPHK